MRREWLSPNPPCRSLLTFIGSVFPTSLQSGNSSFYMSPSCHRHVICHRCALSIRKWMQAVIISYADLLLIDIATIKPEPLCWPSVARREDHGHPDRDNRQRDRRGAQSGPAACGGDADITCPVREGPFYHGGRDIWWVRSRAFVSKLVLLYLAAKALRGV